MAASERCTAGAPVVVTMAATNRYHCLDEALVRPLKTTGGAEG